MSVGDDERSVRLRWRCAQDDVKREGGWFGLRWLAAVVSPLLNPLPRERRPDCTAGDLGNIWTGDIVTRWWGCEARRGATRGPGFAGVARVQGPFRRRMFDAGFVVDATSLVELVDGGGEYWATGVDAVGEGVA